MTTYQARLDDRTNGITTAHDLDREQQAGWRRVWDCGPQKPKAPPRPEAPKGRNGDPEFDLAKAEFQETIEEYQAALRDYGRLKKEYAEWQARFAGPYEIKMWSQDAREALARDPQRYFESHPSLPNHGLPEGRTPGRAQHENEERARVGEAELNDARRRDPQFGNQGVAA